MWSLANAVKRDIDLRQLAGLLDRQQCHTNFIRHSHSIPSLANWLKTVLKVDHRHKGFSTFNSNTA